MALLIAGEAGFEDGTVNYLSLPAVEIGLRHLDSIGIETMIHERVAALTGWLLDELTALRHSNGQPLVQIHGPQNLDDRGGTITLNLLDPAGGAISPPGGASGGQGSHLPAHGLLLQPRRGETTYAIPGDLMRSFFVGSEGLYFNQLVEIMQDRYNISVSAIRVSVGLATNFADVYRLLAFFACFQDRSCADIGEIDPLPQVGYERDAASRVGV